MITLEPLPRSVQFALDYDENTGIFRWKIDRALMRKGDIAGHIMDIGYRTITVDYIAYYAHHLAIGFVTGYLPESNTHVDHINGDKDDNRFINLREVEPIINFHNRVKLNKNNKSGFRGVFEIKPGKFIAFITINRKRHHLGTYDDPLIAKIIRDNAQIKLLEVRK
jgi:hypothetical protein